MSNLISQPITFKDDLNLIEGIGNEVLVTAVALIFTALCFAILALRTVQMNINQIHPLQEEAVNVTRQRLRINSNASNASTGSVDDGQAAGHQDEANAGPTRTSPPPSAPVLSNRNRYGMDSQCPVCLNEPRLPVETNCGHLFCANCLIVYWRHGNWRGPVRCPVCRTQVTVMLTCFRLDNRDAGGQQANQGNEELNERQQAVRDINDYNRRFSGEPRPVSSLDSSPFILF